MESRCWTTLLFAAAVAAAPPSLAEACKCPTQTPEARRDAADLVFTGKVVSVATQSGSLSAVLEVATVEKGGSDEARLKVQASGGSCAVPFRQGERWTVYAHACENGWCTNVCTGTHRRSLSGCGRPIPRAAVTGDAFTAITAVAGSIVATNGDGTLRDLGGLEQIRSRAESPLLSADAGEGILVLGGFGSVLRSSDSGGTLERASLDEDRAVFAVSRVPGGAVVLDEAGRLYRWPDGGELEAMANLEGEGWMALSFADSRHGFAGSACGAILATRDGGKTWTPILSPTETVEALLVEGEILWVSGRGGVWVREREGQFQPVIEASRCSRMHRRGAQMVVACGDVRAPLWLGDGRRFRSLPIGMPAVLLAAYIGTGGELLAAGAHGVVFRGRPEAMSLVRETEEYTAWRRVVEGAASAQSP